VLTDGSPETEADALDRFQFEATDTGKAFVHYRNFALDNFGVWPIPGFGYHLTEEELLTIQAGLEDEAEEAEKERVKKQRTDMIARARAAKNPVKIVDLSQEAIGKTYKKVKANDKAELSNDYYRALKETVLDPEAYDKLSPEGDPYTDVKTIIGLMKGKTIGAMCQAMRTRMEARGMSAGQLRAFKNYINCTIWIRMGDDKRRSLKDDLKNVTVVQRKEEGKQKEHIVTFTTDLCDLSVDTKKNFIGFIDKPRFYIDILFVEYCNKFGCPSSITEFAADQGEALAEAELV